MTTGFLLLPVAPPVMTRMVHPFCSPGIAPVHRSYGIVRPCPAHRYFRPRGSTACALSLRITEQVLKFRTRAQTGVTPPLPRAPHGQSPGIPPCSSRSMERAPVLMPAVSFEALSVVYLRSSLQPIHDAMSSRLFRGRSPPPPLDSSSSRLFGACSWKPAPKGPLPSSLIQHRTPRARS